MSFFSGQAGFGLVSGFSGFSCNITSLIQSYSSNSKLSMQWPWPFGAHLNNEQILTFWFKLRNLWTKHTAKYSSNEPQLCNNWLFLEAVVLAYPNEDCIFLMWLAWQSPWGKKQSGGTIYSLDCSSKLLFAYSIGDRNSISRILSSSILRMSSSKRKRYLRNMLSARPITSLFIRISAMVSRPLQHYKHECYYYLVM